MAIIKIEKLLEFAKDGQKSIQGLSILLGFPRDEKPARDWFNYLFNKSFSTINILIDEINQMRADIQNLKEGTADVVLPDVPGGEIPNNNPVGGWTIEYDGAQPTGGSSFYRFELKHSSGKKVLNVSLAIEYLGSPLVSNMKVTNVFAPKDTDDTGAVSFLVYTRQMDLQSFPNANLTVSAPKTTPLTKNFALFNGVVSGFSGDGGNANQTE